MAGQAINHQVWHISGVNWHGCWRFGRGTCLWIGCQEGLLGGGRLLVYCVSWIAPGPTPLILSARTSGFNASTVINWQLTSCWPDSGSGALPSRWDRTHLSPPCPFAVALGLIAPDIILMSRDHKGEATTVSEMNTRLASFPHLIDSLFSFQSWRSPCKHSPFQAEIGSFAHCSQQLG